MAVYTVHRKPDAAPDDVTLVPEGFNVRAFLFMVLWALWNRLWVLACVIAVVLVASATLPAYFGLSAEVAAVMQLAASLLFGFEANDLRRSTLARSGYEQIAMVGGSSLAEAELRYFAERPKASAPVGSTTESAPSRYAHDTLGLFGNV
jgi:Protein of unknown function (DUF2628)